MEFPNWGNKWTADTSRLTDRIPILREKCKKYATEFAKHLYKYYV